MPTRDSLSLSARFFSSQVTIFTYSAPPHHPTPPSAQCHTCLVSVANPKPARQGLTALQVAGALPIGGKLRSPPTADHVCGASCPQHRFYGSTKRSRRSLVPGQPRAAWMIRNPSPSPLHSPASWPCSCLHCWGLIVGISPVVAISGGPFAPWWARGNNQFNPWLGQAPESSGVASGRHCGQYL